MLRILLYLVESMRMEILMQRVLLYAESLFRKVVADEKRREAYEEVSPAYF
jgi:hypothetical protein